MELTDKDYANIASRIEMGDNYVEYEKDGETIAIECTLEYEGYEENDYYNGTGAFIETDKMIYIQNVESWNEDGDDIVTIFDEDKLLKLL